MSNEQDHTGSLQRRIRLGRVDSLILYEITDHELDQLEQGSPNSLQLNFACALIPFGASFWVALRTAVVTGNTYTVFVVLTVVSLIFGFYFLFSWWRNRKSVTEVIKKIKERVPEDQGTSRSLLSIPAQSSTEGDTGRTRKQTAAQGGAQTNSPIS